MDTTASVDRNHRQILTAEWVTRAFGPTTLQRPDERAARVVEEAVELGQAANVPRDVAHRIVDYVYDRPAGSAEQECGGVLVTMLAFCASIGVLAEDMEVRELDRVLAKPPEHFAERHKAKAAHGITPGLSANRPG